MIILDNAYEFNQEKFGDGTLKCCIDDVHTLLPDGIHKLTWCYDSDSELFTLMCIVDELRSIGCRDLKLCLPYIPNARQDRFVSGRLFTLKTFCKAINSMDFVEVEVLDPHSNVATALLDKVNPRFPDWSTIINDFDDFTIMFPDAGAAKKYAENTNFAAGKEVIIGNKHRDRDGRISDYELLNFVEGTKSVLIIDDICSYGGTFVSAAKALREKGVEKIYLAVSHCEYNIFNGDVFNYVDTVYTTDSILDLEHTDIENYDEAKAARLNVQELYRKVRTFGFKVKEKE